ncbi:unnamed protein product, partial [Ixodes persulcatus]
MIVRSLFPSHALKTFKVCWLRMLGTFVSNGTTLPGTCLRTVRLASRSTHASKAAPKWQRTTSQKPECHAVRRCDPGGWSYKFRQKARANAGRRRRRVPTPGCRSFCG